MLKTALAFAALLFISGCASDNGGVMSAQGQPAGASRSSSVAMQDQVAPVQAELAAYAGSHTYPTSQPVKTELRAAALVSQDQGVIKIYNFDSRPISDADLWVNKAFVRRVGVIPPGSSITVQFGNLYNAVGQQFSTRGDHVNSVQLQQGGNLESLMGPIAQ